MLQEVNVTHHGEGAGDKGHQPNPSVEKKMTTNNILTKTFHDEGLMYYFMMFWYSD